MIGLGVVIGDPELEQVIDVIAAPGDPPSDDAYKTLARRLATLRSLVFADQ